MTAEWVIVNKLPRRAAGESRSWIKLNHLWLYVGLVFSAFAARAEAPPPPREFWDYLMEFGDEQGEVFDPVDLAAVAKMPKQAAKPDAAVTSEVQQKASVTPPANSDRESTVTGGSMQ